MTWFNFALKLNNKICAKLQVKGWVHTPTFIPRKNFKGKVAHLEKNPKKTTKPLVKDASTPPIRARDIKCFKCFGRGHVQAQCPNQRALFLKGKDEYTSGEDEPSPQERVHDVVPMEACHILLGRPWQFDKKTLHDGLTNEISFIHKHKYFVLSPLPHSQVVKDQIQMKHKRDEEKIEKEKTFWETKGVGEECSFPQGHSTRQSH